MAKIPSLSIESIQAVAPKNSKIDSYNILGINWGSPSNFTIDKLTPVNKKMIDNKLCLWHTDSLNTDLVLFDLSMLSITTPHLTSQPIEEWVAGTWSYTTGRPEIRQIDITFRDTADGLLWKNFAYMHRVMMNQYPNDAKWDISIIVNSLELDNKQDTTGHRMGELVNTTQAILTDVSSMQLSKDQADSFTTFSVSFKYYDKSPNYKLKGL
jgi:hypothetical protein